MATANAKLNIDIVTRATSVTVSMPGVSIGLPGPQGPAGGGTGGGGGTPGAAGSRWYSGAGAPIGSLGIMSDWYLNDANGDVYEKTGATSWTLRDNLTGPGGTPGTPGTPGAAGSKWISGTAAPASGVGVAGDWYIDTVLSNVYEKTDATTWALRTNIRGAAGSKWYSGAGTPSTALGSVGDWYLNNVDGSVHEKTGVATWTLRDNLTGPQGIQGIQGIQGPQGVPGTTGLAVLPSSVPHDLWQAVGGAWPSSIPSEIPAGARINWISQPGDTTPPPLFRSNLDSYTHRTS